MSTNTLSDSIDSVSLIESPPPWGLHDSLSDPNTWRSECPCGDQSPAYQASSNGSVGFGKLMVHNDCIKNIMKMWYAAFQWVD